MSKVDVVSQKKDKEKLAHILLFTVAIQSLVTCPHKRGGREVTLLRDLISVPVRTHFK